MSTPGATPKVTINMRECISEDFQPDAAVGGEKKSTQKLDAKSGSVSLLIRIMHKVHCFLWQWQEGGVGAGRAISAPHTLRL